MLFNSFQFFAFFAFVYTVYVLLPHKWQNRFLLAASCVFYGMWNWKFLGLLALSTTFDWSIALALERSTDPRLRKRILTASLVTSLTVLAFFKYYNFFADNLAQLLSHAGIDVRRLHLDLVLPVGISFYTFHMMSYVVDVYHRKVHACRSYVDYALFVTFFPQLVAGPIARADSLLPQVERERSIRPEQIVDGVFCT